MHIRNTKPFQFLPLGLLFIFFDIMLERSTSGCSWPNNWQAFCDFCLGKLDGKFEKKGDEFFALYKISKPLTLVCMYNEPDKVVW